MVDPVAFRFDYRSPAAIAAAQRSAAMLVTRVAEETRQALRSLVVKGLQDGIPPAKLARLIQDSVGLNAPQAQALMNFRAALEAEGALAAAKLEAAVERYRQKLLNQRKRMIARTETMRALNAGKLEAALQAQRQGLLGPDAVKEWAAAPEELIPPVCPECRDLDDEQVLLAALFSSGDLTPPAHPHCRCALKILPHGKTAEASVVTGDDIVRAVERYHLDDAQFPDPEETARLIVELNARGITVDGLDVFTKTWKKYVPVISDRYAVVDNGLRALLEALETLEKIGNTTAIPFGLRLTFDAMPKNPSWYAWASGKSHIGVNIVYQRWSSRQLMKEMIERTVAIGWHPAGANAISDTMIHELGHVLQWQTALGTRARDGFVLKRGAWTWQESPTGPFRYVPPGAAARGEQPLQSIYTVVRDPTVVARRVSNYAADGGPAEFVAETFNALVRGARFDPQVMRMYELLGGPAVPGVTAAAAAPSAAASVVVKAAPPTPPLAPVNKLLPKGAKVIGDPIPFGPAGDEIKKVLELRKLGESWGAIDTAMNKVTAGFPGTWSWKIAKKYGGGRL